MPSCLVFSRYLDSASLGCPSHTPSPKIIYPAAPNLPQAPCPSLAAAKSGQLHVRTHVISHVPEGRGVSSSAAIEVPTLAALAAAFNYTTIQPPSSKTNCKQPNAPSAKGLPEYDRSQESWPQQQSESQNPEMNIPRICTRVENTLVGASCGAMDQAVVWAGRKNSLLCLLC